MIDIKQTALRDSFRGLIDMGLLHADRHDVGSGVFSSDGGRSDVLQASGD